MGPTENTEFNITSFKGVTAERYNFSRQLTQIYPISSHGHSNTHCQRPAKELSWQSAPTSPLFIRRNFSPDTMESSTLKSLTSNSARNISRRLNPLKVQQRIPQHTEDMLHFQLSPMLLTFEQFILQTLSNFWASHHCSHVPTPFSLTSLLNVSCASIPLNYSCALLPEDMNTVSP